MASQPLAKLPLASFSDAIRAAFYACNYLHSFWKYGCSLGLMRCVRLGGLGNIEDNLLPMAGGSYRAVALRSFEPATQTWAIWWLNGRAPHRLDVPVIGRFEDGIGTFFADEWINDLTVRLRFLWLRTDTAIPRWEQAMSTDEGCVSETNWTMDFSRL